MLLLIICYPLRSSDEQFSEAFNEPYDCQSSLTVGTTSLCECLIHDSAT